MVIHTVKSLAASRLIKYRKIDVDGSAQCDGGTGQLQSEVLEGFAETAATESSMVQSFA